MKLFRSFYIFLGFVCLGIGAIGVVLPVLPTTPFLLLASFFFAKGSTRFHQWLTHTSFYQKHIHEFVEKRAMTLDTKIKILIPASIMLIIAFFLCPIVHMKIVIVCLIIFKYYYFIFRIKTIQEEV